MVGFYQHIPLGTHVSHLVVIIMNISLQPRKTEITTLQKKQTLEKWETKHMASPTGKMVNWCKVKPY